MLINHTSLQNNNRSMVCAAGFGRGDPVYMGYKRWSIIISRRPGWSAKEAGKDDDPK